MMDFTQAMRYIRETARFGSKLGLDNITCLMERLNNPEKKLRFAHIAGTNGKGSVAAFLSGAMTAAGYRTGLFISPYISRFNERVSVDGELISDAEIAELVGLVADAVADMTKKGLNHPTEFEIITAMAFLYYEKKRCDIVVLEVGLGGRLDATNVIERPLVSIITSIDFDHEAYLGESLDEIAREKAGIIKEDADVVTCVQRVEVLDAIKLICQKRKARLSLTERAKVKVFSRRGQVFDLGAMKGAEIALLGEHQLENVSLAIEAIDVLRGKGFEISESAVREGIQNARWPGRFEWISQRPDIVIDGAHNIQGARMLAKNLKTYFPGKDIFFVAGALADKNYELMIQAVAPLAKAFFTVAPPSGRALPADALARSAEELHKPAHAFDGVTNALEAARQAASADDVICVFGSLYLVGGARDWVLNG
ncbi:MAG: bifunctional folylpolyglutamate synthase/dihydrofolate synthase [Clostridiales bacterium]|jgi:dihydrofolate synthase/folylpolyglutamate synthase|nr:bifunctional folylpolyglutamate synthase/dihydrofolate synthase [Clostridiales bacterium]